MVETSGVPKLQLLAVTFALWDLSEAPWSSPASEPVLAHFLYTGAQLLLSPGASHHPSPAHARVK